MRTLLPAMLLATTLAACTQTATPPVPVAGTVGSPQGECQETVDRFAELLRQDADSGNLKRDVYGRASADVRQADAACRAGRAVQARSIIVITRRNYGYPPG